MSTLADPHSARKPPRLGSEGYHKRRGVFLVLHRECSLPHRLTPALAHPFSTTHRKALTMDYHQLPTYELHAALSRHMYAANRLGAILDQMIDADVPESGRALVQAAFEAECETMNDINLALIVGP